MAAAEIDALLDAFPTAQCDALQQVRARLLLLLPGATEVVGWGMPCLAVDGDKLLCYQGFKRHNGIFPMDGSTIAGFHEKYPTYEVTKGSIHFAADAPMPPAHLRTLVGLRIAALNDSYPRKSGESKEFYANGFLKAKGKVRDGQLHGNWQWFRRDGTLKRTGQFRDGEKVGVWTTYNAAGEPHRITNL